ncbi:MAG: CheR family methyltransferase [Cyanobacteria bacterium J06636_16]
MIKVLPTNLLQPHLKQAFIQLIAVRTGLKIRTHDQEMLQEVVLQRIQKTKVSRPEDYYRFLKTETNKSNEEWQILIAQLTNTESFFFRDTGQIKLLRNTLLPKLIQQKSAAKTLCICSAGCSTGEEPYSLAILLRDLIPDLAAWELTILGVDINPSAIEVARTGAYRPWSFRGVDRHIQKRFFNLKGEQYYINPEIKHMVSFRTMNLLKDSFIVSRNPIRDMDLILCRNVFIYFHRQAIQTVLDKFYEALSPHGYLLVGHTELHGQNPEKFRINVFEESIAYQRPEDALAVSGNSKLRSSIISQTTQTARTDNDFQDVQSLLETHDIKMQKASLSLLKQLPADTRIVKLGNRTASELILQIEQNLKAID